MTTATVTATDITTQAIELPAGVVPYDFQVALLNAGGTVVAQSASGVIEELMPLNVSALPSGTYTGRVMRRDSELNPIGVPFTAPVVLDQTVEVPLSATFTLI